MVALDTWAGMTGLCVGVVVQLCSFRGHHPFDCCVHVVKCDVQDFGENLPKPLNLFETLNTNIGHLTWRHLHLIVSDDGKSPLKHCKGRHKAQKFKRNALLIFCNFSILITFNFCVSMHHYIWVY